MSWEKVLYGGVSPSHSKGHTSTHSRGKLYIVGGRSGDDFITDTFRIFDIDLLVWTLPPPESVRDAPSPRAEHTATLHDNSIYVFGGCGDNRNFAELHKLSLDSLTWSLPTLQGWTPTARFAHAAEVVRDKLFIVGGKKKMYSPEDEDEILNDIFFLDIKNKRWENLSELELIPRYGHSATAIDPHRIVFYGGTDGVNVLSLLEVFDTETLTITRPRAGGIAPEPTCFHSASQVGDQLLVLGGSLYPDGRGSLSASTSALDMRSIEWFQPPGLNVGGFTPRCGHSTAIFDHNIIVHGGSDEKNSALDDMFLFNLGSADPHWCSVEGVADDQGGVIVAGSNTTCYIVARNSLRNNVLHGGDEFKVVIKGIGSPSSKAYITDQGNGRYLMNFTPPVSGKYSIVATLRGQQIGDGPVMIEARSAKKNAIPYRSGGGGGENATDPLLRYEDPPSRNNICCNCAIL